MDEIFAQITQALLSLEYEYQGDSFIKKSTHKQSISINGHVMDRDITITKELKYLGTGWVGDESDILYGFSIYIGNHPTGDVWVRNFAELNQMCKL